MTKRLLFLVIILLANNTQAETDARCEPGEVASRINNAEQVVPQKIYHFGKPAYLLEDVEARTIPQKAWDEFIMGTGPRFDILKSSRRGLYGTESIAFNDFGDAEYSWLIEIWIKDECRKPENVVTPTGIAKSTRFLNWLKSSVSKLGITKEAFVSECANEQGDLITKDFSGPPNPKCDEAFDRYLQETNVKVVQDTAIFQSYYIRDRNCIETIKGSPEELIEIALNKDTWMPVCQQDVGNSNFRMYVLSSAFRRLGAPLPLPVAEKIKELEEEAPGHLNVGIYRYPLWLEAYIRCIKINRFDKFQVLQTLMETEEYIKKNLTYGEDDNIDALWKALCN